MITSAASLTKCGSECRHRVESHAALHGFPVIPAANTHGVLSPTPTQCISRSVARRIQSAENLFSCSFLSSGRNFEYPGDAKTVSSSELVISPCVSWKEEHRCQPYGAIAGIPFLMRLMRRGSTGRPGRGFFLSGGFPTLRGPCR